MSVTLYPHDQIVLSVAEYNHPEPGNLRIAVQSGLQLWKHSVNPHFRTRLTAFLLLVTLYLRD